MFNIKYTDEMKNQDKLWIDCNEDLEIMEVLHNQITTQFKNQTESDYHIITYVYDNDEVISECFENEEIMQFVDYPLFCVGNCEDLIKELKNLETKIQKV